MIDQSMEISWEELSALPPEEYMLVDIRDDNSLNYGAIPGSVHIPQYELMGRLSELCMDKKIVLYCSRGIFSMDMALDLLGEGYDAVSLSGGYSGWLTGRIEKENRDEEKRKDRQLEIEKSIRSRRFHKKLFSRFAKAINTYELLKENDKVAVCISGGKDSMLMAKLFQEIQRHNKFHFELVFLVMDPGYSPDNRKIIENNAKILGIPITVFESDIFESVFHIEKSPCYLCARMRRGYLYNHAKALGCNKIALGHHYDDVIETILMGMLYGAQVQTMMPKLHSSNFSGMELIRPMYLIREEDIKDWRDCNDLHFLQCACKFTETCSTCSADGANASKRMEIKKLIASLKEVNPFVEGNIFKSVENVNLNTVVAYKKDGVRHHFLDEYDKAGDQMEKREEET
ncbi:MAG: ATPase [Eubacterium sp.]|nr:ATPase [Eubacterium sp.]